MNNTLRVTITAAFSAALFAAESSAFANSGWQFVASPQNESVTSVAAFPDGAYVNTKSGNIYIQYFNIGTWQLVVSASNPSLPAVQITSDENHNLYILSNKKSKSGGVPQIWSSGAFVNYPTTDGTAPGENGNCSNPSDLAIGPNGTIYVAGCISGEVDGLAGYIYAASPAINGNLPINWFPRVVSSNRVTAVAANQLNGDAWLLDSAGLTYYVNSNFVVGPVGRPECVQSLLSGGITGHTMGLWGGLNQGMVLGCSANQNEDYTICFDLTGGTGSQTQWQCSYLGGYAHNISVNQYTAVVGAGYFLPDGLEVFYYTQDD